MPHTLVLGVSVHTFSRSFPVSFSNWYQSVVDGVPGQKSLEVTTFHRSGTGSFQRGALGLRNRGMIITGRSTTEGTRSSSIQTIAHSSIIVCPLSVREVQHTERSSIYPIVGKGVCYRPYWVAPWGPCLK